MEDIMREWYLMTDSTRPNITGGYENDAFLDYRDDGFSEALSTELGTTVKVLSSKLAEIEDVRVIVQGNSFDSKMKYNERAVLSHKGVLKSGFFVYFEDEYWLVTSRSGNNGIYDKTIMQLCTWNLKWQDENGEVLSYPCVTSNSSISQDSDKVLTINSNKKYILLPFNDSTSKLRADKRFFLDRKNPPTPYKIIGDTDTTTNVGIIEILLEADKIIHEIDNVELGICNYWKDETEIPPTNKTYSALSINGSLNVGGSKRTITPKFYDSNGVEQSGITPIWEVALPSKYESYFTVSYIGNTCTIQVKENYDLIGLKVTVKVNDSSGNYPGELVIEIGSGW